MSNANWMSRIQGNPKLVDMVLPGSHDAGVYGDSLSTRGATKGQTRCQGSNIYNQALAGSRVFDCRVFLKKVKQDDGKKAVVPTMGHFGIEKGKLPHDGSTGMMGGHGGSLVTAVKDAIAFVKTYPSEFIILRFSHTHCPGEVGAALSELMQNPAHSKYVFNQALNIARCRLGVLRGKVVMTFASEFHKNFRIADGFLPFYRHGGRSSDQSGLTCCGIYKGTSDMAKVARAADEGAAEHKSHELDHLHWVYWQQTMTSTVPLFKKEIVTGLGNIQRATTGSGGAHEKLGDLISDIRKKRASGQWRTPNVIGHDFVTAATCKQIFELNVGYGP